MTISHRSAPPSDIEIAEIISRRNAGESAISLGRAFGISKTRLYEIFTRHGAKRRSRRKLSEAQISDLLLRRRAGEKVVALSQEFGLSQVQIYDILKCELLDS